MLLFQLILLFYLNQVKDQLIYLSLMMFFMSIRLIKLQMNSIQLNQMKLIQKVNE